MVSDDTLLFPIRGLRAKSNTAAVSACVATALAHVHGLPFNPNPRLVSGHVCMHNQVSATPFLAFVPFFFNNRNQNHVTLLGEWHSLHSRVMLVCMCVCVWSAHGVGHLVELNNQYRTSLHSISFIFLPDMTINILLIHNRLYPSAAVTPPLW